MVIANTSSSANPSDRLLRVPLARLRPHPANANQMSEDRLAALARNIEREGEYPPLVARPHPDDPHAWQLLDGHQRLEVLRRLGHADALVFAWPCDDATALVLLATLNRLEGSDVPARRAQLLADLTALVDPAELAQWLPEDAAAIEQTLSLLDLDADALVAQITAEAERREAAAPRLLSFAVEPADEPVIEVALAAASAPLEGRNRRGRALAAICRTYSEEHNG